MVTFQSKEKIGKMRGIVFSTLKIVKTPSLWGFKTQILKHANSITKGKLKLLLSIVNQTQ
jgi:hypothetical protein